MKNVLCAFVLMFAFAWGKNGSDSVKSEANPLSASTRIMYNTSKDYVLKAAEEMPEENYSFRPAPTVRTYGQLVAHVADAQYSFCSTITGDGNKGPGVEKNKTSKADILQALKEAFAYCDQAYDSMTDAHAADIVNFFFNRKFPKLSILNFNSAHNFEHYENMVTYLRIKGLTPPSIPSALW